MVAEKVLFLNV